MVASLFVCAFFSSLRPPPPFCVYFRLCELAGSTVVGFGFVIELTGGFKGRANLEQKWGKGNVDALVDIAVAPEH